MLRLTRPADADLMKVARRLVDAQVTYLGIGATATDQAVPGYRSERFDLRLGEGAAIFDQAVSALRNWQPHRGSGISVAATGPIEEGTVVAMAAPLPIGFVTAACRVVYVEETVDRYAFAYGTLPGHPEEGEERFEVSRIDEVVTFTVSVFSRPAHPLARLGAPIAKRLQHRATEAYLDAMRKAVTR